MYCYNCGTPNPDNAPFCTHCNAPLTAPNDAAAARLEMVANPFNCTGCNPGGKCRFWSADV